MMVDDEWKKFGNYIEAMLYFEKITTGNATKKNWNISESRKVQRVLAHIISDYIVTLSGTDDTNSSNKINEYVRALFTNYCFKKQIPRFNGIDQIQQKNDSQIAAAYIYRGH